jgi:tetratricopeptide (TPR) repeat protein
MKKEKEEKKKEDDEEEEEKEEGPSKEDINDMFNTAAEIKSYQLAQERKKFDSLPDFYKDGLFNYLTLINVRNQKFYLKKCSFETMKNLGIQHLKFQSFDEAITEFSKSISIFKYIIDSNPNWKNGDGIKDSELTYIYDEGSNKEEKEEIKNMLKSSLLNLSLCNFYLKNWKEVKFACDEVIKIDNKCIKAYFRKARCIIDNPASLMNDYLEAKILLEKANEIDPNNNDVKVTLNNLNEYINKEKSEEKKIYKSFYRKINEQYTENEKKKKKIKKIILLIMIKMI